MVKGVSGNSPRKAPQSPKSAKPKDPAAEAAVGLAPAKKKAGRPPGPAKPAMGHNKGKLELTEDEQAALLARHAGLVEPQKKKLATANSELQTLYKKAKADGVTKGDIEEYLYARDPDNEAKIKAKLERTIQVYQWAGIAMGSQLDLFGKDEPATDKAFKAGKVEGVAGRAKANPHHHTVPQHKAWDDGWSEGQAANVSLIAGMNKPAEISDDEFEGRRPN